MFNIPLSHSSLSPLVPSDFSPAPVNGQCFLSLIVGTLRHILPVKPKIPLALSCRVAIYQIPVKTAHSNESSPPVALLHKIFLSHPFPSTIGNILTNIHFDTAHIECHRIGSQVVISVDAPHQPMHRISAHGNINRSIIGENKSNPQSWKESASYFSNLTSMIIWSKSESKGYNVEISSLGPLIPAAFEEFDSSLARELAGNNSFQLESSFYIQETNFLWRWLP